MIVNEPNNDVSVVGAGHAGLAATKALTKRGYEIAIAEAGTILGG